MSQHKNKKGLSGWLQCEKCYINITSKDIDTHLTDCPPDPTKLTYDFVKDTTLFGTLDVKANENIKGVSDVHNLVFLSQAVIQLCGFSIGDWVMITFSGKQCVAKIVWPTIEKTLTSVLLSKYALELTGESPSANVTVTRLPENLPDARIVNVVILNAPKSLETTSELTNRLQKNHIDRFLRVGNIVSILYFGKLLKFQIKEVIAPTSTTSSDLEENFKQLSLETIFFKCTDKTTWAVFNNSAELEKESVKINPVSRIGGLDKEIFQIRQAINICFKNENVFNFKQPKTVLLFGHSGTGKTALANAVAEESNANFIKIYASNLYGSAESPDVIIKTAFEDAIQCSPAIILLDQLDILCPIRSQRLTESEKKVTSVILSMLDQINTNDNCKIFIIATTNTIDSIDQSLRCHGRFNREMEISTPNPKCRRDVLKSVLKDVVTDLSEPDFSHIALNTHGFVASDLISLCSRASLNAIERQADKISLVDFKLGLKHVRPSAMREVQVEVANVQWSDIGGQDNLKLILRQAVEWPLKYPESFVRLGVTPPKGVLMFGPPGCSKTMIAKALATESGLNFLSIKGPELFSKWVGESEKAVREVFRKARQVAPSVIFFDEIDALGGERSSGSSTNVQERVLAQLLTELDGVTPLGDVTVLAATNRPDRIDKALLRPGRLDRIVYVPLPDPDTRREIFKLKLKKMPVTADVDVEELVSLTERYSGAEVNAICHEAAMMALEENLDAAFVERTHFIKALKLITPRTPPGLTELYEDYLNKKINSY